MVHESTEQTGVRPEAAEQGTVAAATGECCGASRRALLRTLGLGGAVAATGLAAAACATASSTANPAGAGAPVADPAPTGSSTLGPSQAIPVGGGVIYEDAKIVVTQPTAGTYKGFSAVCTHMQCIVASVSNNVITCGCHGSEYSAVDGSVERGPATQGLPAATIKVQGGIVTMA